MYSPTLNSQDTYPRYPALHPDRTLGAGRDPAKVSSS